MIHAAQYSAHESCIFIDNLTIHLSTVFWRRLKTFLRVWTIFFVNKNLLTGIVAGIYLFKVNNGNSEICSKLTIKTPERRQWRLSGIFIINFEQISHIVVFPSFTFINAGWVRTLFLKKYFIILYVFIP